MPAFFDTPPGASGNTPAADRAPGLGNMQPEQLSALARLFSARSALSGLTAEMRRKLFGGGSTPQFGGGRGYQQTIGFGIEE